ncbi:hypothetical protein D3P07_20080 [Paenibacillus sp. 1011MAR3C5]|uniref:S-layer homology domain-containing protein n=1 Tax=Paenibacillus sp. 1011MAR3C5 TaxID=1675787 RepID=UPI000E6BF3B8|nr:S-layer homology domain-containing protein [Paenibacillus sp. 1011MAR3C5]RJE86363.1 hypothetical protein D3P07_20080 [Paenibacillus sp. 1011MAR3C5]
MIFTINRTKFLSVALVLLLFLSICSPFSAAAEVPQTQVSQAGSATSALIMNQQRYSDVPDTAWYAEAVNTWVMLGILNPKQGDKLSPQLVMTRGEFARFLAISLELSPSKNASKFKDIPADGELTGYVTALHDEGLAKGYTDGTFRPNSNITRAEVASLIVTAKKLKSEPQGGSQFRDVPQQSWYAGAVGALTKAGIVSGKSKDSFAPNANIVLAEGITLLYRSFFSPSIIQDIADDGTIKIDGQIYRAGKSVQGIFQLSNKAALHNAAIQFTNTGDTISSVEGLIIGYKDALAGMAAPIIFDAKGNTVNGNVIVSANQVAVARLEVKGDLNLAPAVQSDFFAFNVLVQGKTVFLKDNGRPNSQITNIWFEHSDLGQLFLFNSALVKKVDASEDQTSQPGSKSKGEVRTLGAVDISFVSELYISYFDHPSAADISFYLDNINADFTIATAESFASFPEYSAGNDWTSTDPTISASYTDIFGRQPDPEGLAFWVGAITSPLGSIGGNHDALNVSFANINSSFFIAGVDTELSLDESSKLDTLTLHGGVGVEYDGQLPIGTLTIDTLALSAPALNALTSFAGLSNIGKVTMPVNAGRVSLNVPGIDTMQLAGGNTQLALGASTSIHNLIVPPEVNPASFFENEEDFSGVKAINGQSTAQTPSPSPSPSPSPEPSPNNPNNPNDPNGPNNPNQNL